MPELELELISFLGFRLVVAFIFWQTIWLGATFRVAMRREGWSTARVRLVTAGTWVLVIGEAAAYLIPNRIVFVAASAVFLVALLGSDRILAAIHARPCPRMALVRKVTGIFAELGSIDGPDARGRLDADLADLDRWVEPETFEFIQLARSRVLAWLDGGPRAADREARWSTRMNEIAAAWMPAWTPDGLARLGQGLRKLLLRESRWLAFFCGALIGVSVLFGRSPLLAAPLIVFGWIATWEWKRVDWVALVGVASGFAVAVAYFILDDGGPLLRPWLVTVAGIEVALLLSAWLLARRAAANADRPRLRLVGDTDAEST